MMGKISYYNDYTRHTFHERYINGEKRYFIKIDNEYVEVEHEVFKVIRASYIKIKQTHKKEVEWLNSFNKRFNYSTFYMSNNIYSKVMINDLMDTVIETINNMDKKYKDIAILFYLDEYSIREISIILDIPKSTVAYRKKIIDQILRKSIKQKL